MMPTKLAMLIQQVRDPPACCLLIRVDLCFIVFIDIYLFDDDHVMA